MTDPPKRVVVVTGGARGIGRAVCAAFAEKGTHLYFNYLSAADAAAETIDIVKQSGGQATAVQMDVADEEAVIAFFNTIVDQSGQINVLVNNAGLSRDGLIPRMKAADWEAVMDVNLKGAFFCIKAASRQMLRQRSGRIINVSSVVALAGNPGQSNYSASKSGLLGLTKSVAAEFASRNITVNAVAPGYISTDMTGAMSEETRDRIARRIPLGRLGDPEDVAAAVVFLASPGAAYITGQVVGINGGLYM